jgi:hypothetical protein
MDGDAEKSGVTEGLAKVSEVAGTEAAGTGLAKRPGADGRPRNVPTGARSGRVPPGGRRGTRRVPGDKAVAGFADLSLIVGRSGACGTPGADALPGVAFLHQQRVLTAVKFGAAAFNLLFFGLMLCG